MVTAIVGRAAFFPFPGVDNPAVCVGVPNNCTITSIPTGLPPGLETVGDDLPTCKWPNGSDPFEHQNHGRFVSLRVSFNNFFMWDTLRH